MTEAEREDRRKNMHFLEEELAEKMNNSAETVTDTRCDECCKISEMEDKVYAKSDKAEETRHAIYQHAAEILSEEK